MTRRALLVDLDQHGVAVAVQPTSRTHCRWPLVSPFTQYSPRLREKNVERPVVRRLVQGQVVHPAHHQHLSSALLLDHGRDQSGRIALEQCGDLRVQCAAGEQPALGRSRAHCSNRSARGDVRRCKRLSKLSVRYDGRS